MRHRLITALAVIAFVITVPSTVLAQGGSIGISQSAETAASHPGYIRSTIAAAVTFSIGWLLVSVTPETMRRQTDRVRRIPGLAFGCGLASLLLVLVLSVILLVTMIGSVFVRPLLVVSAVGVVVGSVVGYLAVGQLVTDGWRSTLAVAAVVAGITSAVPIFGSIIGFVIGFTGIGSVVIDLLGSGNPKTRGRSRKRRSERH